MRRRDLRVLIAGGGIGGITTALALRQRGIDVQLFEQADAFREVGAGIQLSANATRVIRTLGLGEALARVAVYPEGRDYRAWDTGERVFWTPLGEQAEAHFGAPYYQSPRCSAAGGGRWRRRSGWSRRRCSRACRCRSWPARTASRRACCSSGGSGWPQAAARRSGSTTRSSAPPGCASSRLHQGAPTRHLSGLTGATPEGIPLT